MGNYNDVVFCLQDAGDDEFELDDDHYAAIMRDEAPLFDAEDDEAWDAAERGGSHPDGGHPFVPATPFGGMCICVRLYE